MLLRRFPHFADNDRSQKTASSKIYKTHFIVKYIHEKCRSLYIISLSPDRNIRDQLPVLIGEDAYFSIYLPKEIVAR
jgi:hypothetical protein